MKDLTVDQVAEIIGRRPWTVRKMARNSDSSSLFGHRDGGEWKFSPKAVETYIKTNRLRGANDGLKRLLKAGIEI